jgi:hypothetical protein
MNELLALDVEAHGGIDRWNRFKTIDAKLSLGGALWSFKQQPDLFAHSGDGGQSIRA